MLQQFTPFCVLTELSRWFLIAPSVDSNNSRDNNRGLPRWINTTLAMIRPLPWPSLTEVSRAIFPWSGVFVPKCVLMLFNICVCPLQSNLSLWYLRLCGLRGRMAVLYLKIKCSSGRCSGERGAVSRPCMCSDSRDRSKLNTWSSEWVVLCEIKPNYCCVPH